MQKIYRIPIKKKSGFLTIKVENLERFKFKLLITWSRITTGTPAFRLKPSGYLSDMAGFSL